MPTLWLLLAAAAVSALAVGAGAGATGATSTVWEGDKVQWRYRGWDIWVQVQGLGYLGAA